MKEVNDALKDQWFVVDNKGQVLSEGEDVDVEDLNDEFPEDAPHHAVQLQVKGTLPEGAVMPKYKVGDRVAHDDGSVGTVRATQIRYLINFNGANLFYADDNLKPADPMRDEFEKVWASQGNVDEAAKEVAYIGFRLAKAGAK